jgi:hypothetical protein
VLQFAEVLLNKDDIDAKADALIDFIRERVVGKDFEEPGFTRTHRVQSFADLDAWFRDVLRKLEDSNGDTWRTHHAATVRKVRNRLSNLSTRCAGLVTDDGAVSDLPFGSFVDRAVYVVDVANVEEDAQDLVFARVVSRLREQLERRELGVDHVIVFVDELNKNAHHIFDGHRLVDAVLVVEVDVVGVETLQARFATRPHVFGTSVDAVPTASLVAHDAKFGGDDGLLANAGKRFAQQFLVGIRPVHIRAIEEIDAQGQRAVENRDGGRVIRRAIELRHAHTAKPDTIYCQITLS